jgi:tetrahydromethanopterin S-methyltransferase subunit G
MPPKVPALPREAIERALYTTGVSAQDIRAVLTSDDWRALESRNQQIAFFRNFVKNEFVQRPTKSRNRQIGRRLSMKIKPST